MSKKFYKIFGISTMMMHLLMGQVSASDLTMIETDGNSYLTLKEDGVYYYLDDQGNSYSTITYKKQAGPGSSSMNQFVLSNNVYENITVLCDKLYVENKSDHTNIMINTNGNDGKINIGTSEKPIDDITVIAGRRFSQEGLIVARGNNNYLNFNANNIKINVEDCTTDSQLFHNKAGISLGTMSKNNVININANNEIDLECDISAGLNPDWVADALTFCSDSVININAEDKAKVLNLKGNIYTANLPVQGYDGNSVNVTFNGTSSTLTGCVYDMYYLYYPTNPEYYDTVDTAQEGTHLTLKNGARWNMADNDLSSSDIFTGYYDYETEGRDTWNIVTVLDTSDNSVVDMSYKDSEHVKGGYRVLQVYDLKGNGGIFNMDIDASINLENSDRIYVENTHTGQHYITLNNIHPEGLTDGSEGTVLVSVNDEQGKFLAKPTEGTLYWNKYELASKESLTDGYNTDWYLKTSSQSEVIDPEPPTPEEPNPEPPKPSEPVYTTSVDTIMSTNALNYHTWRESDKLLQRMGELRHNGTEEKGAWFRVKGSEIERSGLFGFGNKYTTYQLGYDEISKRTDKMTRYQGFALSYTDGNSSYKHGSGDNHSKAISFYNTDQRSKGHYLDLVLQISDMDNDFKVYDSNDQKITGDFDNKGISISAEYGRKKDLGSNWYIEPQAQMTFGYLSGDDYTTSNGIKVEQSGIFSAVGRVGFNIGKNISERGIIYAKANVLHEFGGDYDVQMRDASGQITKNDRFNDTWFAYGVGAAFATDKQSHIYFDVEKTTGSDFSKNWQWNAGIRYNF